MNILVTGASGFIGHHLCNHLSRMGISTSALLRNPGKDLKVKGQFVIKDFLNHDAWESILKGVDAIIHTAGLAHLKGCSDQDYYNINTEITKRLALECVKAGVKRFVYTSTTHVHVSSSSPDILTPTSPFNPKTAYGKSKLLAEENLKEIEKNSDLEVVVIRPPLVYGPGVAGNVLSLLKAIKKGIPLPVAAIQNKRSMVFVDNLVDALTLCAIHPAGREKTYFVSDDHSLSIGELIQGLAKGMGEKANLFYFPETLMKVSFNLFGKEEVLEKIIGSLELDTSDIQKQLGWKPIISVQEGLERTGYSFR